MQDVYINDVWRDKKGITRKVVDLIHEGYDPDDPNDMGSFEEYNVHFKENGRLKIMRDYDFGAWIERARAVLIESDNEKVGYRDDPC